MIAEILGNFGMWILGIVITYLFFAVASIPAYVGIWTLGGGSNNILDVINWTAGMGAIHFFLHSLHPVTYIISLPLLWWTYNLVFNVSALRSVLLTIMAFSIGIGLSFVLDYYTGFGLVHLAYGIWW